MSFSISRRTALSAAVLLLVCGCSLTSAFVSPAAFGSRHADALRAVHSSEDNEPTTFATAMKEHNQAVRSVVAGIVFSFALVAGSPITGIHQADNSNWFVAHAEDSQQSLLTSPTNQEKKDLSLVEEVWTLIDKFYIDRSFNGQVRTCTVV
jgi:hypothetical protein